MQSGRTRGAPRIVLVLLFGLSFLSNLYFLGSSGIGNPNGVCRVALTIMLIEHGTTSIDPLANLTIDKGVLGNHRYCDKAPGLSFLAIPVAAVFIAILNPQHDDALWHKAAGLPGGERFSVTLDALIGLCTAVTAGFFTAVGIALLCSIVMRLGGDIRCAVATALICGQATPIWFWATAFIGHSAAAGLLIIGFYSLLRTTGEDDKRTAWWALGSGVAFGWATLVDFTAAVPVALLTVLPLLPGVLGRARWSRVILIVLGGLPELGLLLAYNAAAFGSPFELGYAHAELFDGMRSGFFGLSAPRLSVLWEITVGRRHGLLWLSPVVALAPLGAACAIWSGRLRHLGVLCVAIVTYYLLLNSAFVYWDGGYSTGPRQLTTALPFACLLLVPLWERGGPLARRSIAALGAISGLICFVAVAVDIAMPSDLDTSMADYLLSQLWQGRSTGLAFMLQRLGWPPFTSLLPFVVAWGAIATALVYAVRNAPGVARTETRLSPSFGA